jgi:hypothetical protein
MLVRKMVMGAALAVLLALVWKYLLQGRWDARAPASIKHDVMQAKEIVSNAGLQSPIEAPTGEALTQAPAGIHKCKVGNKVTYTDAPCQSPAAERPLDKGSVTVVKTQRPQAPDTPEQASRLPNVRDLAGKPGEPSLMDKQIERAVNH